MNEYQVTYREVRYFTVTTRADSYDEASDRVYNKDTTDIPQVIDVGTEIIEVVMLAEEGE